MAGFVFLFAYPRLCLSLSYIPSTWLNLKVTCLYYSGLASSYNIILVSTLLLVPLWVMDIILVYGLFLYVTQLKLVFSSLMQLQVHPFSWGQIYKNQPTLKVHMRVDCNKVVPFACHLCSFKAKQKTSLKVYIVLKHL